MSKAWSLSWLCLPALMAGCAQALTDPFAILSGPEAKRLQTAQVAPGRTVTLPRPADLGRSVEAAQLITVRHGGHTFAFEGRLSVTPERLVMVGVDPMGRRAMTVTWTATNLSVETAPWMPSAVQPVNMLADLVVLLWPEAVVRVMLGTAGCELRATQQARKVRCDEDEVLRATYAWKSAGTWSGTLKYTHLVNGYEIEVQSQEMGR